MVVANEAGIVVDSASKHIDNFVAAVGYLVLAEVGVVEFCHLDLYVTEAAATKELDGDLAFGKGEGVCAYGGGADVSDGVKPFGLAEAEVG